MRANGETVYENDKAAGQTCLLPLWSSNVLVEEGAERHRLVAIDVGIISGACFPFAGKHGFGALFVLFESHALVDAEAAGHVLDIEVVGADEREGPILLLQLLYELAHHLQRPFLGAVLVAVGDDGHQDVVVLACPCVECRDGLADGIVRSCP